jgi:hypothetical protein
MKSFLVILSLFSHLAFGASHDDIVIKSRLDHQSSAAFINRIRTFLINNNFGDPYNREFEAPVEVDFNQVLDDLPANTQSWIKEFQNLLNLKLFESNYILRIENFSYEIQGFNSELKPFQAGPNRVEYVSQNYVQGLELGAKKIVFQVELKRTTRGTPITFDIELIKPTFLLDPELVVDLPMGWRTSVLPDSLLLSLHTIDLSKVFSQIGERPELISFNVQDFSMPEVSIKVGGKTLTFDRDKIKRFLSSKKEDMKLAIIDLIKTKLEERFSNIIKDKPQEMFIPRSFSTKGEIETNFKLKSLNADDSKILDARVDGSFCSERTQNSIKECRSEQEITKVRRNISDDLFYSSMKEIDLLFMQKRANIVFSISENYINQLITAAAQAGLLELGGEGFRLGPEKAFILAEEKGEGFSLYLDIIHKLKKSQRILVGKSELRFPVRLNIGLKIILEDKIPHLKIKVLNLKTDTDLLLEGKPEYGLQSNVGTVRFQKKVIEGIMEDIQPFDQKVLVELELKEFKDTALEELSFASDGKGRANAVLYMENVN